MSNEKQPSGIMLVIVLVVIATGAAALLAFTKAKTEEPIKKAELEFELRAVRGTLPEFSGEPKTVELESGEVCYAVHDDQGRLLGIAVPGVSAAGYGGDVKVMVGILPDGMIHGVKVVDHKETPGLGSNAEDPEWLAQFQGKGKAGFKWAVKKDGGDIDAITAATITSRAVTIAVREALGKYEEAKGKVE